MIIPVFSNQVLVAVHGSDAQVYSDPIPLAPNYVIAPTFTVHYIVKTVSGTVTVSWGTDVSNDGMTWWADSSQTDSTTVASGTGVTNAVPATPVHGAFVRFWMKLAVVGDAGEVASSGADLIVSIEMP